MGVDGESLNNLQVIENIDSKKSNSSNHYGPFHIASRQKTGEVQDKYNNGESVDDVKNHILAPVSIFVYPGLLYFANLSNFPDFILQQIPTA
jgi:hypothetical protein